MLTPTFFARQRVLVIGGGKVAERKIKTLLESGAKITVIAPALTETLKDLAQSNQLEWQARSWQSGDVANFPNNLLVFVTTDNSEVNQQIANEAKTHGRLVNIADDPANCDFTLPGVVQSGEITLAVATGSYSAESNSGNVSPALTAYLRRRLQDFFGPEYSELAQLLRELRPLVKQRVQAEQRPALWRKMVESDALNLLRAGQKQQARILLENFIDKFEEVQ